MNRSTTLLILLGILILGGGGYAVYSAMRGIRNNNPLNIEDDGITDWEGLDSPRNDGGPGVPKLRFVSPEYGFRAAGRIINNYVNLDGIPPTVNGIIRRWSATDQDIYVEKVSRDLDVDPDQTLNIMAILPTLLASMTGQENGINPYSMNTILTGLAMA